jgi:uncharacterized membrane protein YsdA (DUF1294 family)
MAYTWILLLIVNIVTFITYLIDKSLARRGKRRIPEKSLIALAVCFGGVGAWAGMHFCHHKTKKTKFRILVPLLAIIQIVAVLCFRNY